MSGDRSIKLIKKLFLAMADREEIVEIERQKISSLKEFNTLTTFNYIDSNGNGYITHEDLISFMKSNDAHKYSENTYLALIRYFDMSNIGRLWYSDYSQILLSWTNDNLRWFASQSNQSNIEHKQVPSQECLSHLCTLFEKELDYHNDIETIKQELWECENFDINNLFDSLDFSKQGFLDFSSIQKFLTDNKFKATESDVNSILRRMDLTANAQISLAEFIEGTKYIRPKASSNLEKVTASTPNGYLTSLRKKTIFNNIKLMNEGFCKENKYEYQADASIVAQERREISIKSSYLCYKKDSKLLEPTQSTPNRYSIYLTTNVYLKLFFNGKNKLDD